MPNNKFSSLICPFDGLSLLQESGRCFCPNSHSFDVAKQGYINLLPVQNKRSKEPGDSKQMVAARREFLDLGHYRIISETLAEIIDKNNSAGSISCLDAGCGEGYYLHSLAELLSQPLYAVGVDISKWAIQAACKRNQQITWLVASNASLPVESNRLDFVFCLFGFPVYEEFRRVLKPQGKLIMVDPNEQHLYSLRQVLYPNIQPKEKVVKQVPQGFSQLDSISITHDFTLTTAKAIEQLALMTPHWFKSSKEGRGRLLQLELLSTQLAVEFQLYEKT